MGLYISLHRFRRFPPHRTKFENVEFNAILTEPALAEYNRAWTGKLHSGRDQY
jgi:hypothetical protein